jgi:serine/threonine protein kinase/DNA-binding winged helix-turn-helix (wHTH) protein
VAVAQTQQVQGEADGAEAPARRWAFAQATLDERSLELRVSGEVMAVERKPLEVLLCLLHHAGEVVTKDELLEAVWPGRILTDTAVATCVAKLREALGDETQAVIKTVHGYGYRLVAPVKVEASVAPPLPRFEFKPGDHPSLRPLWSLVERLGQGSHGEVWLARHDKTHEQRVYKFALDSGSLASLKREITLYRLLHDSIGEDAAVVRILDWNLEQPPFFTEAEYISGGSLLKWAESMGGASSVPLPTRLDLVIQLAEALALAHSVGVLHKDLKPGNVLVETGHAGAPHIKLGDFGSGGVLDPKRLDQLGITRLGFTQVVDTRGTTSGTPLYLAPEILAGQPATVQGDIYALGVLLYQLVCGDLRKPLSPGWEHDIGDELLSEDIGAAAAGDPQRRLADAATLAQRLRSLEERRLHRNREREEKLKAEQVQRALERLRARRTGLLLALAVLVIGVVTSFSLYLNARRAQKQTAEREQELAQVVSFQNAMLKRVKPEVMGLNLMRGLREKVGAAGPERTAQFENLTADINATDIAAGQMDEAVLKPAVAAVEKDFASTPLVQASLFHTLGESYQSLGLIAQAQAQFERTISLRSAALGAEHEKTLESRVALVLTKSEVGRAAEGAALLLETCRRALGERHRLTLKLRAHVASGEAWSSGHMTERKKELEQVLEIQRGVLGQDDEDTLGTMTALAFLIQGSKGRKLLEQVVAIQQKHLGAEDPKTLDALFTLAIMRGAFQGEYAASRAVMEQILDISRRVNGTEHPQTVQVMAQHVITYGMEGDHEKFQSLAGPILALCRRVLGPYNYYTLDLMGNLGESLRRLGKLEEARKMQEQALDGRRRGLGPAQQMTMWSMHYLAETLKDQKQFDAALKLFREELELRRRTQKELGIAVFPIIGIGNTLKAQGKLQAVRELYEHWLKIIREEAGGENEWTLMLMTALADTLKAQNQLQPARELYQNELEIARRTQGAQNPALLPAMKSLLEILKTQKDSEAARKLEAEIAAIKPQQP